MVTDFCRGAGIYEGLVPQGRTARIGNWKECLEERETARLRISKRDKHGSPEQKSPRGSLIGSAWV